jgi:phosphate:Na+ symporter
MGANVGTTFSAQLIAFRIDAYAPIFMFVGVVMYLFIKKKSVRNIGYVILGFGVLFFSITVMGDALREFRGHPAFLEMIAAIANPFLALLAGFVLTIIVQSSSATMGLLVTLHLNDVPIPFETSAFIILGANIGTSITAAIAAIPASRDSRRAALFHITYDIIGSLVFGSLIILVPGILIWFQTTWSEGARQVAMFHTLYNVATLLLLISFVPLLAKLMQAIIPIKQDEAREIHERRLLYLDKKIPKVPTLAVINAHLEISRMGKIAHENISMALEAFYEKSESKAKMVVENEKIVDFLHQSITEELIVISNMQLLPGDAERVNVMISVMSDMERISDHADNIAEYTMAIIENKDVVFSEEALKELKTLGELTTESVGKALSVYENQDSSLVEQVEELEEKIDALSKVFADNHVQRLKRGACEPYSGVIFIDIINDLERSSDHAENIAFSI